MTILKIFSLQTHIMRVPVYLVCAAALVAVRGEEATNYFGRQLEPVDVAADQETISYLLPKLAAKYRPSNDWSGVTDPRFYVLTEMESNDIDNQVRSSPTEIGCYIYCIHFTS